jgi:site-specific DNA-cytosine methylase
MNKFIGNIFIACEYSGRVRDAFENAGWNAWSCDLLPTESEQTKQSGKHIQGDVFDAYDSLWLENCPDMLIAFPPCTYLTFAGNAKWLQEGRTMKRIDAAKFFMQIYELPVEFLCVENPQGVMTNIFRKPDQIIHPYYFGDREMKRTCFWLKNLPPLKYTLDNNLFGEEVTATEKPKPHYRTLHKKTGRMKNRYFCDGYFEGKDDKEKKLQFRTGKEKSLTFPSVANAMAEQWTEFFINQKK